MKAMKTLGKFVIGSIVYFIEVFIYSFALSEMWGWFISPIFNVPIVSIPQCMGFYAIIRFINVAGAEIINVKNYDFQELVTSSICKSIAALILLLIGFGLSFLV